MTDDHTRSRPISLASLVAGALLLGLGACSSGSDEVTPQQVAAQAAQQPATQPAAAPAGPVVEERLNTANCRQPASGRVYFGIGQAVFAVPGGDVRTVIPPDVSPTTPAEQIVERLRAATASGSGCPEKPLVAGLLGVASPAGQQLLAPQFALFLSEAGAISAPYARLTREMLGSPEKCRPADGGLLACPALETDGGQQMQSLYFVSTETSRKLSFGGPLAARCVIADNRIRGCEIVDELPGGIGLRAPLTAVPQSSAALAAAHQAAVAHARALRI